MPSGRPWFEHRKTIEETDRPRGILSKHDRQYLLDPTYREELTAQSQRNVRARIRKRLRHALLDFYLLEQNLDERDCDQVFSSIDEGLKEGIHSTLALLYRAAEKDNQTFQTWLEGGLTHIDLEEGDRILIDPPRVRMEVTPSETVVPKAANEKVRAGNLDELTAAELRFLLWRAGLRFGYQDDEDPINDVLNQYVKRFEERTQIAEVRELLTNPDNW